MRCRAGGYISLTQGPSGAVGEGASERLEIRVCHPGRRRGGNLKESEQIQQAQAFDLSPDFIHQRGLLPTVASSLNSALSPFLNAPASWFASARAGPARMN